MLTKIRGALRWLVDSYVIFVVIGLVVGGALAPAAMEVTGGPDGTIAIVRVDGTINGGQLASYTQMMQRAREEADAVVVVANSGGGSSVASEGMYLQTKRTAAEIPVVASVDAAAASGAYFTILPAEQIYVKPSSVVGSVGVIASPPPEAEPTGLVATSGPDKLTGGSGRPFYYTLESIQRAFLNAVFEQRGDRIRVSRARVERATTFVGLEAVELGIADAIGDRQRAVDKAAELADLDRPRVVVYGPRGGERTYLTRSTYLASKYDRKRMTDLDTFYGESSGYPTFLMVPASLVDGDRRVVAAGTAGGSPASSTTAGAASPGRTNGSATAPGSTDAGANRTAERLAPGGGR